MKAKQQTMKYIPMFYLEIGQYFQFKGDIIALKNVPIYYVLYKSDEMLTFRSTSNEISNTWDKACCDKLDVVIGTVKFIPKTF